MEQGVEVDDISDRLLDLNSQKADLVKQVAVEENRKPSFTKEQITYWLTKFVNDGDITNIDFQRRIIDTLINRVYVFDGDDGGKKIVITYNTSANVKSTVTLSDVKAQIKSSDINGYTAPKPTNPNFFIIKNLFGIVITDKPSRA